MLHFKGFSWERFPKMYKPKMTRFLGQYWKIWRIFRQNLFVYFQSTFHYFDTISMHCASEGGVCRGRKQSANKTHLSPDHQLEVDHSFFLLAKQACAASFFCCNNPKFGTFFMNHPLIEVLRLDEWLDINHFRKLAYIVHAYFFVLACLCT